MMKEEMEDPEMEGKECWEKIPEGKKKSVIKSQIEFQDEEDSGQIRFPERSSNHL